MSGTPDTANKQGLKQRRGRSRTWLRWFSVGWWAVIVYLALNLRDTFASDLWPALRDALAALLAQVGGWPFLARIGFGVLVALVLAGLGWLTYFAFQKQKEVEREGAEEDRIARIAEQQEGNEPIQKLLEKQVELAQQQNELTRQQIEVVSRRLAEEAPVAPEAVVAPTGLPRPATLVGRETELKQLMEGLRAGESVGIFALAGMGGVGKTAIAAEAVAHLSEDRTTFPGGAAWIPCDDLRGDEGLAELWTRVARALRLEQVSALANAQERRVALAAALAQGKRVLLALDNIEPGQGRKPGLDADAALDTLAVRGHTAILLTARQVVAPRRLTAISVAPLEAVDARALFVQRLQQIDAARPTAQEAPAIPKLLEAVGGLPLALELTAAYAGVQRLSLEAVVGELETDGIHAQAYRDHPQRALVARFERSWRVLTARQQRLFAGLSLLVGASFPRAAALALAQATVPKAEADAEGDLATLVSYALAEPLAGERMRLHPLLREYAGAKLAKLPKETRERLGEMMVAFWRWYADQYPGYAGMDALEAEAAGLMGALAWAHEQARRRELLALVGALAQAWRVRGRRDETLRMYNWANEAARALGDAAARRLTKHQLAVTLSDIGRLEEARAGYEEALALARQLNDPAGQRDELHGLAVLNGQTGRLEEARAGFEEALALARQLNDPAGQRAEIHELAVLNSKLGRLEEARAGYEEALALARQLNDPAGQRDELNGLAVLNRQTGRLEEARAGYEEALALARQLKDPDGEAVELCNFGLFLCRQGESDQGRQLINESLAIGKRLSNVYHVGKCHQFLAWLEGDEGHLDAAIAHYREALRCFEQVQSPDAEEVRADLRRLEQGGEIGSAAVPEEVRAIQALLNTPSWDETRAVLEREQALLLTERADELLSAAVEQARQGTDAQVQERAAFLEAHLTLLRRARELGVADAWAEFEALRRASEEQARSEPEDARVALTREEAERASQDAAFLAEKFGLALDDPQIPALQERLRQMLENSKPEQE